MTTAPEPRLKELPSFLFFWTARASTSFASAMQVVAVGWQIYDITGSVFDLGMIGLIQFVPSILLFLVAGPVIDRYDRRRILQVTITIDAMAVGLLAVSSMGGWITRDIIFAAASILGATRAFTLPAQHSLLPTIVPQEILSRAIATSSSAQQFATIAGPAAGGLLYAISPVAVYGACVTVLCCAIALYSLVKLMTKPAPREPVSFQMIFGGLRFIRDNPVVLGAISLDMFAVLLGGATALLPVFARDVFQTGPWGLGLLRTAPAIGALVTAYFLARTPLRSRVGRWLYGSVAGFGVATIAFAISMWFPLAFVALMALGVCDMISVVIRQTIVQLETPDQMRGRVGAVNSLFVNTSNQIGEFESGVTAAWFGAIPAVVLGGAGTILVVLLWIRLFPQLYAVESLERRPAR